VEDAAEKLRGEELRALFTTQKEHRLAKGGAAHSC
jgi:hypothetical protein